MPFRYQIVLMGNDRPFRRAVERAIFAQTDALGIARSLICILRSRDLPRRDIKAPLVAIFFGHSGANRKAHPGLKKLLLDSIPIVPCVERGNSVTATIPKSISQINAFTFERTDASYGRLATLALENLRLLRSDRRLFISYKRSESQSIAMQLYEELDKAGFDVFLDTRSIPFGVNFQSTLWHRMADSDVVILLDTPRFRESYWTVQELAQANSTSLQILHLLWPGMKPDQESAFSEFLSLQKRHFRSKRRRGPGSYLTNAMCKSIVAEAESLRARALAVRHRNLVDNFCDRAREESVRSIAVQPERFISLGLKNGTKVAVVPTVGVPRADRYHEMELGIRKSYPKAKQLWLLYDERGILETWLGHLEWLNSHLPVTAVQVSKCAIPLRGGLR